MDFNANYKLDFKDGNGNFMVTATESLGDRDFVGDYEELYYDSADDSPISDRNRTHKQNKYNTNSKFTLNLTAYGENAQTALGKSAEKIRSDLTISS